MTAFGIPKMGILAMFVRGSEDYPGRHRLISAL